jgi:hypothetical protein
MESLLLSLLNMKLDGCHGCLARIVSVQYPLNMMICEQQSRSARFKGWFVSYRAGLHASKDDARATEPVCTLQIQAGVDASNDDVWATEPVCGIQSNYVWCVRLQEGKHRTSNNDFLVVQSQYWRWYPCSKYWCNLLYKKMKNVCGLRNV